MIMQAASANALPAGVDRQVPPAHRVHRFGSPYCCRVQVRASDYAAFQRLIQHSTDSVVTAALPTLCRWFSGDVQGGLLTASSCGFTAGDPVVTILKSTSPDGNAKTLSCVGGNDDGARQTGQPGGKGRGIGACHGRRLQRQRQAQDNQHARNRAPACNCPAADDASCPANTNTIRSFTSSVHVEPQTYCEHPQVLHCPLWAACVRACSQAVASQAIASQPAVRALLR